MYFLWFLEENFTAVTLPLHRALQKELKPLSLPFLRDRPVYLLRHSIGKKFAFFDLPKEKAKSMVTILPWCYFSSNSLCRLKSEQFKL